jgi:hypothetical protein
VMSANSSWVVGLSFALRSLKEVWEFEIQFC